MALGVDIVILMILLALSGYFSGAEVALLSLSAQRVKRMVEEKNFGAKYVKKLKDDPHRMLSTILIGNNVVNVGASVFMTTIAIELFGNAAVGIATGVMTFLVLIFGEVTPKAIAQSYKVIFSQLVAYPVWVMSIILFPLVKSIDLFLKFLLKLLGQKEEKEVTEEDLKVLTKTAANEGSIKEFEEEMIHNILEIDETNVSRVLTPRNLMVSISVNADFSKAREVFVKSKFSRLPVYEGEKDNVVGLLYLKDCIPYLNDLKTHFSLKDIMHKPYLVPETKKISSLMKHFQKRKEQMAIVIDEHGHVTGVVTMEDILEEIVGEIMDETDKLPPQIKRVRKSEWIIDGRMDIDDVFEELKLNVEAEGYESIAGFLQHVSGKIPEKGEVIEYDKYAFIIQEKENNTILKVKVKRNGK